MEVFTYISSDAPDGQQAIARIRCTVPGKVGKRNALVEGWHPVIFHGPTEADVRDRAESWWAAEVAKEANRQAARAKAAASRQAKAAGADR
jgi:hypothetical protein